MSSRQKISVSLITKNAAHLLERTLLAVSFADEIVIVDSKSTDGTQELAKRLGARVIERDFINYGEQKNHAESHCQGPWILNLDADEVLSDQARESILEILELPLDQCHDIYEIDRLNYYCNQPIRHGGWSPDYNKRLYKKNLARWSEPMVHEKLESPTHAPIGRIHGVLHHYTFETIAAQVATNIRYAQQGAQDLLKRSGRPLFITMIIRGLYKFFELYLLKAGFLDGKNGFIIAVNGAHSQFLKYAIAHQEKN